MANQEPTKSNIEDWLVAKVAELTDISPDEIEIEEPFMNYGISSQDAIGISGDLEEWLKIKIPPTLMYDYPTIEQVSQHLSEEKN